MTADVPTTRAISDEAVEAAVSTFARNLAEIAQNHDYDLRESRNLGYYRTGVTCACGEELWWGGHDGDPKHYDVWVDHLAEHFGPAVAVVFTLAQSSGRGADHALAEQIAQAIEAHLISIESDWQDGMRYAAAIARTFADEVTGR